MKKPQPSKPKVGRPARYSKPRISIAARLQAPLHDQIKRDAEAAGRSISEEIESRLQKSFADERSLEETWGSREVYAVAGLLAAVMYDALLPQLKTNPNARLLHSPAAFVDATAGIAHLLARMRPKNAETDVAMTDRLREAITILAPGAANGIVAEIIRDPSAVAVVDIRQALGHLPARPEDVE